MKELCVSTTNSKLKFEILNNKKIALIQVNTNNLSNLTDAQKEHLVITELQVTGDNFHHKGLSFVNTSPGANLTYLTHEVDQLTNGKLLKITSQDPKKRLVVTNYYQLFDQTAVIRSWVTVENISNENIGLEYISSFAITGLNQGSDPLANYATDNLLYTPHNNWQAEAQWHKQTLKEAGLDYQTDCIDDQQNSSKRINITNNSSWSCAEFSPSGILTNTVTKQTAIWQIENNGAWHYELTDSSNGELLSLRLSGPEELDNHWWKNLAPGESFTTATAAFCEVSGNYERALQEITKYRRLIRNKNQDNQKLPVIFNDYMNGLMGDPTEATERPLIDAAAKTGCDYFVIDCGWYSDGYWWDSVGDWLPSKKRFPNGIESTIQYIRDKGLTPGLWLEIEVIGIHSPLANQLPDSWFFKRHGKRIIDCDRYHLDFNNPDVRSFADKIMKRLIEEYGVGYIKMDYNITTGIGTEQNSDSFGDGLLNHNRAYLKWLDHIFEEYPELVIENCGSGGMRHDYAMLQRHSIQSMTDQTDYVRNGNIAAVGSSVVTPEQCAIWSYPLQNGDSEEVIFNMINAMLVRIHQSGLLNHIDDKRLSLVAEGIRVYKTYREKIPTLLPIWPDGLGHLDDEWYSFGLANNRELYLAVWHGVGSEVTHELSLEQYGTIKEVTQIYPAPISDLNAHFKSYENTIKFTFNQSKMARLYHISLGN
jgi:alpha-galactosidase